MVEILSQKDIDYLPSAKDLLYEDEVVVIVDDSPEVILLLDNYLTRQDIPVAKATNADELFDHFLTQKIALILLDIGLPGKSGKEILAELAPQYPDLGIIMVTGTTDIQTALDCLRLGADDYLTKPVVPREFNHTIYLTLKKRRLAIENRTFQNELERTNFRMQFLHNLNLKMNSAYLSATELDTLLHTILAGITSDEGLRFNRAFLALFDDNGNTLTGKLAIGPSSREEAGELWKNIKAKKLGLHDILDGILSEQIQKDTEVNRIVARLKISALETKHILICSSLERRSILVKDGHAPDSFVPDSLINILDERNFVVVPLFSPSRSLGVIIADNYVTAEPITEDDLIALEIFANQASLAIEHSHLYQDMMTKIEELELVTSELDKNKDMLIEAERYSTIGYISAQLVHAIRNPVTSIGGTARLLLKRTQETNTRRFLQIMAEETAKIEETLKNLFQFVEDITLEIQPASIIATIKETLAVFYGAFRKYEIELDLRLPQDDIVIEIDELKIRKVLMHLIRNSIEAMETGGRLTIKAYRAHDGLTIDIVDTGTGVMESDFNAVTNPFYTTKTYGTGLGLTLVEQILKLHGANFTLEQLSPHGTKATIVLPFSAS